MADVFLLDAPVLLSLVSDRPDEGVKAFMAQAKQVFVSSLAFHQLAAEGVDAETLAALQEMLVAKTLHVDACIAAMAGDMMQKAPRASAFDSLIAATARIRDAVVVSDRLAAFKGFEVMVQNPFAGRTGDGKKDKIAVPKRTKAELVSQQSFLF